MKKRVLSVLLVLAMIVALAIPATAATMNTFTFDLSADGAFENPHDITVESGTVVTVVYRVTVDNTKGAQALTQDEISFDETFFEYVNGSLKTDSTNYAQGMSCSLKERLDGKHYVYFNNSSVKGFSNGVGKNPSIIGFFQLKVIAKSGSSMVVSRPDEIQEEDGKVLEYFGAKTSGNVAYDKQAVNLKVTVGGAVPTATAPTAKTGLVYNGQPQTGVEAGEGYTLSNNTATNAGNYSATATLVDGYKWSDSTTAPKTIAWSIAAKDITAASAPSQTYTGSALTPAVTVKAGDLDATFTTGDWSGNLTDIGTYTATVTGSGNFKGSKDVTFEITPKGVVAAPTAKTGLVYNGQPQTGVEAGEGYTLSNNTATNAGYYSATATLADGYKWSDSTTAPKTIAWSIAKREITSATAASQQATGSALTPQVVVKAGDLNATFLTGDWSGNLTDIGTYTATVTGIGNYTGSQTVTFEITPKGVVAAPTAKTGLVYNGQPQTGVAAATGYTVVGGDGTDSGTYQATATLAGGYQWNDGTTEPKDIVWSIAKREITSATAASQEVTGSALTPQVVVKAGNLNATFTTGDWSGNLTDIGTYTATVTGTGNFTGTQTVTFEITPKGVVAAPTAVTGLVYNGQKQTGVAAATGYTVVGGDGTDSGTYQATATLADGYQWNDGTTEPKDIVWSIAKREITSATAASQEVTGSALTPQVIVKAGDLIATYEIGDWSGNLTDIGTYTATVTGTGNFTGTQTVTFEITHVHALTPQAGLPAQIGVAGYKDYYECECGKYFEDAEAKVEITDLDAWKSEGGRGYIKPLPQNPTPQTGDANNIGFWVALMLAAAFGIGVLALNAKEKRAK